MPTLLAIHSSPRADHSASRRLTTRFVADWTTAHPGGAVIERDLMRTHLPFVDLPWIGGAYTPAEQHSPEIAAAIKISNDLVAELKSADHIVLGTPMYNFSIPAVLKAYIDHIVRLGLTFTAQYEGLVTGKAMTVILASGGDYAPGARAESLNVAGSYLKQIFGFIGIKDVDVVLAGGSSAVDQGKTTLEAFAAKYEPALAAAAA